MKNILKALLLLIFIILSNTTLYSRIVEMIDAGKGINLVLFVLIWIFCLLGILAGSYLSSRKFRVLFASVICFSTFSGMTYLGIGKHFLNFEDMELLWISKEHASKVFSFYLDFMVWPFIVSLIGFIGVSLRSSFINIKPKVSKFFNAFSLLPFIILSLISYQKGGYGTKSMPMQYSSVSTFFLFQVYDLFSPGMNAERLDVDISLTDKNQSGIENIIFIVDESIRADYVNFQKNNPITPYISNNLGRIISFGEASSANNCSGYSNAVLRLGGIRDELRNIGKNPTIWNYAKKAGYNTYYVDGQLKNGELQNFMSGEELSSIDHFIQFDDIDENLLDHQIALKLRDVIKGDTRSFVYVNKRGAHFPYLESYDQSKAVFLPQMDSTERLGDNKDKFINAYKNSINWNVDKFFEVLLEGLDLSDSILFYTSDHGQNLLDKGIQTHCNTVEPHPFEGLVPAAVITDNPELKSTYILNRVSMNNKLTHFHFFPEILKNMGYEKKAVLKKYGVDFNSSVIDQEFSAGAVLPRFGKEVQWYPIR